VEDSSAGTRDLIRQIDRLVLDIKARVSEQAVGSSQILESIIRINEISGTIQAGSGSIRKETDETSSASERLAVTSEKVLMQSEAIAADAQRISQAAADVGKAVERNEERLGTLEQAIDRFSVREDQP
jgi:methyl-accepting chemotaxis protein